MVPNLARTVPSGSCVLQLQHARLSKTTAMKAAQSAHPVDDSVILDRIRQQFDGRAGKYDAESNNYHSMLAQQLLSLCDLQPGQQVLDLASGTGMVALPAAAAVGPDGRVVAVDLSEAMLAQAKAKAEAQRLQGRMEFIVGGEESEHHMVAPVGEKRTVLLLRKHAPPGAVMQGIKCGFGDTSSVAVTGLPVLVHHCLLLHLCKQLTPCFTWPSCLQGSKLLQATGHRPVR